MVAAQLTLQEFFQTVYLQSHWLKSNSTKQITVTLRLFDDWYGSPVLTEELSVDVIAELTDWLAAQLPPPDDIDENDPREIVRRSLSDLTNNRQHMNYPHYRRQGLPMTSTLMESLIKEMNYRVKGSENFWNNPDRANHILAVKAAALSEEEQLTPDR